MTTQSDSPPQAPPQVGVAAPPPPARPGFRAHAPVVAAAVLVGLICGLPHVFMALQAGAQGMVYVPLVAEDVAALTYDETTYYAPRVREVMDGRPLSADPAGFEHKGRTPFLGQAWLDSLVAGGMGLLLGRSVPNVFIVCDFVLPPLSFLLLWALCRQFGAPQWVSIAGGLMVVLAHDQVTLPIAVAARPSVEMLVERLGLLSSTRPVEFCRLTVPQLSFIFCAAAMLGLVTVYYRPRPRRAVLTGVLVGAVFYSYVYYWTFVLAGGVLLLAGAAVDRQGRRALTMIALALAVGLLVGAPVLYQAVAPEGFAGKEELMARQGWGDRHIRWWHQKHELAVLAALLLLYPKRRREFVPVCAFMLAPFACIFAARLVGMNTQEWHWLGRCWQPWSAVAAVLWVWALMTWWRERRAARAAEEEGAAPLRAPRLSAAATDRIVFGGLCVLLLLYATNRHVNYAYRMADAHAMSPELHRTLEELELRADTDSVVVALNTNLPALIVVHTHCNVFLPYCLLTPMPAEELVDRAAVTLAAYGVDDETAGKLLRGAAHLAEEDRRLFRGFSRNLANWLFHMTLADGGTPPEAERAIRGRAQFYGPNALQETAGRYRADFILWGPLERELGREELEEALAPRLFIEAGDYRVYRVGAGGGH